MEQAAQEVSTNYTFPDVASHRVVDIDKDLTKLKVYVTTFADNSDNMSTDDS